MTGISAANAAETPVEMSEQLNIYKTLCSAVFKGVA